MNITSIQKHYDKLSTVERFTALNAAWSRGDDSELAALRRTAPKKQWEVSTTKGLFDAFDFLASWHVMTMQEYILLYWLLVFGDEMKMPDGETWLTMMRGVIGKALSRHAAWVEVCKEYGAAEWQWLEGLPGADGLKQFVDMLESHSGFVTAAEVEVNPEPYAADYRASIAELRRRWE